MELSSTSRARLLLCRMKARHDCLIYRVGSNGEFSFAIDMKKTMPHCEIHTFDKDFHPYPNDTCIFHTIKFGDGAQSTHSKTWDTILQELNHANRTIDLLKMDIEGDEYSFFSLMFNSTRHSLAKPILLELHPQDDNITHAFFERLRSKSYVIFAKEETIVRRSLVLGIFFRKIKFTLLHSILRPSELRYSLVSLIFEVLMDMVVNIFIIDSCGVDTLGTLFCINQI